jgi:hypothetical protein
MLDTPRGNEAVAPVGAPSYTLHVKGNVTAVVTARAGDTVLIGIDECMLDDAVDAAAAAVAEHAPGVRVIVVCGASQMKVIPPLEREESTS